MAPTASPAQDLLRAARTGDAAAVRAALAAGGSPDSAGARQRTALMWAARRGDAALVRLLVNAGADAGRADVDGQTAATLARAAGHGALADWIEQRAGQQR